MEYNVNYYRYSFDIIEKMYNKRIAGIPISFFLLDLRKTKSYCHHSSNIMAYLLETSRITANIDDINGEDNSHSWVEYNNNVLDSTQGLVWNKDDYYKVSKPYGIKSISFDDVEKYIKERYGEEEVIPEVYIAMIKDIENNIEGCPYKMFLLNHIKRFKAEKNLNQISFNKELVDEYLKGLKEMYDEVEEFIK